MARYQINYIIVKQRCRNQMNKFKTSLGVDININSDYNLIILETELKLKIHKK